MSEVPLYTHEGFQRPQIRRARYLEKVVGGMAREAEHQGGRLNACVRSEGGAVSDERGTSVTSCPTRPACVRTIGEGLLLARLARFRAKRAQLERCRELLPESQAWNLAWTV